MNNISRDDCIADLELIRVAAREASDIALKYFRQDPEVWWKEGVSPVSAADLEIDQYLQKILIKARPDYGWLSEETIDTPERLQARRTFVVDPIDGTRAFIAGSQTWCISIAVVEAGSSIAGVLNCPATEEEYSASYQGGAFCNGQKLSVRKPVEPYLIAGSKSSADELTLAFKKAVSIQSYVPSLAYRVAMIADGRLDGTLIKPRSHDWDLAAADLILREADGAIIDVDGKYPAFAGINPQKGSMAAGSKDLLEVLINLAAQIYH